MARAWEQGAGDEVGPIANAVDAERVAVLHQKAPVALITVIVNSTLVCALFVNVAPTWLLATWWAALATITSWRFAQVKAYRRDPGTRSAGRWERRFVFGSGWNGVTWGAGASALVTGQLVHDVVLVFVVGGMVAGASASLATSRRAFLAYTAPAIGAVVVRLALLGSATYLVMAIMLLLFGAAMTMLARQGGDALIEAIRLRMHNASLLVTLEQRSVERANRLRSLLDRAGVLTVVADPETFAILDMSENAASMLGPSWSEWEGRSLVDLPFLTPVIDADAWTDVLESAREEERTILCPMTIDDDAVYIETSIAVQESDGHWYALIVAKDVTQRRALEEQLASANHLASLGTLAAGVAHEINNPLTYVTQNLRHLATELSRAPVSATTRELLALVSETTEGTERIGAIVRDLLRSAKPEAGDRVEAVDLAHVIQSCLNMTEGEIRHRARVELVLDDLPDVAGSVLRLTQVFLNLLLNAAQALPDGNAQNNLVRITAERDDASGRIRVHVQDTGAGIAAEHLGHIFEPFYTTKPIGHGSGLGLSVCHGIVTRLGGRMSVRSERGKGSTFTVELVAAANARLSGLPPHAGRDASHAPTTAANERFRLLVIDDEARVAKAIQRLLAEHDVTVMTNAREGLDAICDGAGFDAVICDLMMPDLSGEELYREVARRAPHRVDSLIFATGGAFTDKSRELLATMTNPWLEKPFDVDRLRAVVGETARRGRTDVTSDAPPTVG